MKEDILEQLVEDWLHSQHYFTMHNVKFRPRALRDNSIRPSDAVHSDIDVLGINPRLRGPQRVMAISCKSWQGGFAAERTLSMLKTQLIKEPAGGQRRRRPAWKFHRELWIPKWAEAFRGTIKELTGSSQFTYVLAVTKIQGNMTSEEASELWGSVPKIVKNLDGNPFRFLTFEEIWETKCADAPRQLRLLNLAE